jgi:glycosyltransferase involved in cell wall biosynthesis
LRASKILNKVRKTLHKKFPRFLNNFKILNQISKTLKSERSDLSVIKVVRIIARLNVGGPARHVVWLTKALQDEKFQSVLITGTVPKGEDDMGYFAFQNGVEPVFIPEMSRELSPKDFISLLKIYRILLKEKPNIIHTHTAKAGTLGRVAGFFYRWFTPKTLIGKPRKVKIVHTYHGHIFHSYYGRLKTTFFLLIERFLALVATDRIVVISKQQLEEIHGKYKIGRSKQFVIIPLGIDLLSFSLSESKREKFRSEFSVKPDEILVGIVGRLTEIKNHSLFLEVAKLSKNQLDRPVKFIIIGDGYLRADLEQKVRELGIEDVVIFAGNRNDADSFYAGLDILVLTSLNEGTPLSLIEGMASSKPIVSTTVGGVRDLLGEIKSEENGFFICERGIGIRSSDSDDLKAKGFCNALQRLINDEMLLREISKAGFNFITQNYSKERLIADIRQLYEDLIASEKT